MAIGIDADTEYAERAGIPSGGFKLAFSMAASGSLVYRSFDTATLATFRTTLDALIATIS